MTDRELMQQALEMVQAQDLQHWSDEHDRVTITALRERLARPDIEVNSERMSQWVDAALGERRAREEPQMVLLDPDIAKILHDNLDKLYIEDEPARQEQEPVAWMFEDDEDNGHKTFRQTPPSPEAVAYLAKWNRPAWTPLYTAPQREWAGLTEEEILRVKGQFKGTLDVQFADYARAIEAKLREKNA